MECVAIPCTAPPDTVCVINWTDHLLTFHSGLVAYSFPFTKCNLTHISDQVSPLEPFKTTSIEQQAIVHCKGYQDWVFTLHPDCQLHADGVLSRLKSSLGGLARIDFDSTRHALAPYTNALTKAQSDADVVLETLLSTFPAPVSIAAGVQPSGGFFSNFLLSCRALPNTVHEAYDLAFGPHQISFLSSSGLRQEPVFLRVGVFLRHGHCLDHVSSLSPKGIAQAAITGHLLQRLLRRQAEVVNCSTRASTLHNAQIIIKLFSLIKDLTVPTPCLNPNAQLGEIYPYPTTLSSNKQILEEDNQRMPISQSFVEGFFAGKGPLWTYPANHTPPFNPADLIGNEELFTSKARNFRFPPLPSLSIDRIAGVYVGRVPSLLDPLDVGFKSSILVGHSNWLRATLTKSLGLPQTFWTKLSMPHCSLALCGLERDGRTSMIFGDALASLNSISTLTFVPENAKRGEFADTTSVKPREIVPQWRGKRRLEGIGGASIPGDLACELKQVIFIRHGQNRLNENGRDEGLTELGATQIRLMAQWLASAVNCGVFGRVCEYAVAGVVSNEDQNSGISVKESVKVFQDVFREGCSSEIESYQINQSSYLTEEFLFGWNTASDAAKAIFLFGSEIRLKLYVGAAFGIRTSLSRLYWPHGGFQVLSVMESGFIQMPFFGNMSHLPAELVSFRSSMLGGLRAVDGEDNEEEDTQMSEVFQSQHLSTG